MNSPAPGIMFNPVSGGGRLLSEKKDLIWIM